MDKLKEFFFTAPKNLNQLFYKSGLLVLIGLMTISVVQLVDGPNHRLGYITFDKNHSVGYKSGE